MCATMWIFLSCLKPVLLFKRCKKAIKYEDIISPKKRCRLNPQVTNHVTRSGSGEVQPGLGVSWSHVPRTRILLERVERGASVSSTGQRSATLIKSSRQVPRQHRRLTPQQRFLLLSKHGVEIESSTPSSQRPGLIKTPDFHGKTSPGRILAEKYSRRISLIHTDRL